MLFSDVIRPYNLQMNYRWMAFLLKANVDTSEYKKMNQLSGTYDEKVHKKLSLTG